MGEACLARGAPGQRVELANGNCHEDGSRAGAVRTGARGALAPSLAFPPAPPGAAFKHLPRGPNQAANLSVPC